MTRHKDAIETIELDGFTCYLFQDEDCSSPREWDNLGTMVCWHRSYKLGDKQPSENPESWLEGVEDVALKLPLGLIDHSGISMYVDSGAHSCDPGGWDSGQVGWIYVTKAQVRANWNRKHITAKLLKQAEEVLRSEVEEYDKYLTGDCYYYLIEGPDGERHDSCGGFIGLDYAKGEAVEALKDCVETEREETAKVERCMAL